MVGLAWLYALVKPTNHIFFLSSGDNKKNTEKFPSK